MDAAVRSVHFAAVLLLFGGLGFLTCVAWPAFRAANNTASEEQRVLYRWLLQLAGWSLAVALTSGVLWFVLQAASMSGLPLDQALNRETLSAVLNDTLFGQVCKIRLGLLVALVALLWWVRHAPEERARLMLSLIGAPLAGAMLATLAWAGHAAAGKEANGYVQVIADAMHLLAAGAWLGGLPPLVFLLARARWSAVGLPIAADATRRFSTLGIASVAGLVLTGSVNSWYLVGGVPALLGTMYGRLLMLKLALFALMLALAAVNRLRLTPQLVAVRAAGPAVGAAGALRGLWRNATLETMLGLAIVTIVGVLGVTIPAAHTQPVWPFAFTLDWDAVQKSEELGVALAAAGGILGVGLLVFGLTARSRWMMAGGFVGIGAALAVSAWMLAVPAYPTTYYRSPVRYTAASIARGGSQFAQHCAVCHGPNGYGDGPAAAALSVKPANLAEEHLFHHREGDLFWWLTHGIRGTPMPEFSDRTSEIQRWDLINFLRAQAEAEQARQLNAGVEPWRATVAPDFTFQIDGHGQETLKQQRGRSIVLLVLYTFPESLARLCELAEIRGKWVEAGVRIVAVAMDNKVTAALQSKDWPEPCFDLSIMATPNPDVVTAYAMFRRTASIPGVPPAPAHMEFLIDRQGYLRARWIPAIGPDWSQTRDLLGQIESLNREKPRPPAPEGHPH